MSIQTWKILYTHQKTKKKPGWTDGILKFNEANWKASVYEEGGKNVLDHTFMPKGSTISSGEEFETDRFRVQVEEFIAATQPVEEPKPPVRNRAPSQVPSRDTPAGTSDVLHQKLLEIGGGGRGSVPLRRRRNFSAQIQPKDFVSAAPQSVIRKGKRKKDDDEDEEEEEAPVAVQAAAPTSTNEITLKKRVKVEPPSRPAPPPLENTENEDEEEEEEDEMGMEQDVSTETASTVSFSFSFAAPVVETKPTLKRKEASEPKPSRNVSDILAALEQTPEVEEEELSNTPDAPAQLNYNGYKLPRAEDISALLDNLPADMWDLVDAPNTAAPHTPSPQLPPKPNAKAPPPKPITLQARKPPPPPSIQPRAQQPAPATPNNQPQPRPPNRQTPVAQPKPAPTAPPEEAASVIQPRKRRIGISRSSLTKARKIGEEGGGPSSVIRNTEFKPSNSLQLNSSNSSEPPNKQKTFRSPMRNTNFSPLTKWSTKYICFPDQETCDAMSEAKQGGTGTSTSPASNINRVRIPDFFNSFEEYKSIFTEALIEELNLQMLELALNFRSACAKLPSKQTAPGSKTVSLVASQTTPFELSPKVVDLLRAQKLPVYASCKLVRTGEPQRSSFGEGRGQWGRGRGRGRGAPIGDSFEARMMFFKKKAMFVQLPWKEHSSKYAKDDLWVLSSNPSFTPRNADEFFFIARSDFHGPGRENFLEIRPIGEAPARLGTKGVVHALHGPEASSHLTMMDNLQDLPATLPILPHILYGNKLGQKDAKSRPVTLRRAEKEDAEQPNVNKWKLPLTSSRINTILEQTIASYELNEDQERVLLACVKWFEPTDSGNVPTQQKGKQKQQEKGKEKTSEGEDVSAAARTYDPNASPIALVHGVFGSGKSYLLVVLIIFISRLLDESHNDDVRILVAACTNTAVDRIMEGLLDKGFTEFLRVGSLKKIARPILPYSPQADDKIAEKDLTEMQKENDGQDDQYVRQALEALKSGHMKNLVEKIKSTRVIGVTCAATVFPILKGNVFPLVILDECSQMLEPLSLLPLGRFGCERLVAVGDPLQLPPVLESWNSEWEEGLAKTLFIRLSAIGYEPIMLRTQYRCHPLISGIANGLFYSGRLIDGVTPNDRSAVSPQLPTLMFCNCEQGKEQHEGVGKFSLYNQYEIRVVIEMVKELLTLGVEASQLGIIALYKAQALKLQEFFRKTLRAKDVSKQYVEELIASHEDLPDDEEEVAVKTRSKKWIEAQYNKLVGKDIQVSTVDAFQGSEKDIIIVTCIRTTRLGFIDSPKRLNVALTRARRHLFIVGHRGTLVANNTWREIISAVQKGGMVKSAEEYLRTKTLGDATNKKKEDQEEEYEEDEIEEGGVGEQTGGEDEDFQDEYAIMQEMEEEHTRKAKEPQDSVEASTKGAKSETDPLGTLEELEGDADFMGELMRLEEEALNPVGEGT